ncbi:hypothetical protein FHR84_000727 [Actinopolyspora biskrensis]|uniref:Uncharacterized protein n=1 Tax=Actinopolyspora biskrensis TaxID=1470178 RepID=A0A852Z5A1_9ACTN|nr:hypothetical protein [Actinopolyspora biskrensis]NYH77413.1 hypothetical protein [Actinopolyspora biskrensis]
MGEAGEGDVAVPAGHAAALEVIEAVCEFAVVAFDAPAHFGELQQPAQVQLTPGPLIPS